MGDILPSLKKLAVAFDSENYNILQVSRSSIPRTTH